MAADSFLAHQVRNVITIQHITHAQGQIVRGLRLLPFRLPLRVILQIMTCLIVGGSGRFGLADFFQGFREEEISLAVPRISRDHRPQLISNFGILACEKQSERIVEVHHLIIRR